MPRQGTGRFAGQPMAFLPASRTARSALAILGLVHAQRSSAKRLAVEVLNRTRAIRTGHFHKSEASQLAGVTVGDQTDRFHRAVLSEQLADLAFAGREGQVSNKDFHSSSNSKKQGLYRPNTSCSNATEEAPHRRRTATWIGNASTLLDSAVRRADGARHTAGQGQGSRAEIYSAGTGLECKDPVAPPEFTSTASDSVSPETGNREMKSATAVSWSNDNASNSTITGRSTL